MERSFILVTAVASVAMFAGVWIATSPNAAPAPALTVASVDAVPTDPAALSSADAASIATQPTSRKPAARTRIADLPPTRETASYNVVRSAYGAAAPPRRASGGSQSSVFYSGCRAARAAGATPLYRGQPGYRAGMDGDGDGIACEAYR